MLLLHLIVTNESMKLFKNTSKMSKISIFGCIKNHLKLGDYFPTTFATWDEKQGKIKLIGKSKSKLVHSGTILQLAVITVRIWSVVTKATNLMERVIGVAITSLTTIAFLLRFQISADFLQVQFLNFAFSTRGTFSRKNLRSYRFFVLIGCAKRR